MSPGVHVTIMAKNISSLYSSLVTNIYVWLCSLPDCPVWWMSCVVDGRQHLKTVVTCFLNATSDSASHTSALQRLWVMLGLGIPEMVSVFLRELLMAEITEAVQIPTFSCNKIIYTSTDYFYFRPCSVRHFRSLGLKAPCQITV